MGFPLVPKSVTLNGVIAILRYFAELGSFCDLRKSGWR